MCGIVGEWHLNGPASEGRLRQMLCKIERRGPDDEGLYIKNGLALGHRRLSIIDLSEAAHQPMQMGHLRLVFNGCIYNYRALQTQLNDLGFKPVSEGDTAVILAAYMAWGEACVEHLDGMFAFALWDEMKQSLFVARDRLGIKPLYYSFEQGVFRFASNMQALLATGDLPTDFNPAGLHQQFMLHGVVLAPQTIFKAIHKLTPGTSLTLNAKGELTQRTWWTLHAQRPVKPRSEEEWLDALDASLKNAVKKRLLASDVPVGVLLSGGLDSSLLVAYLAEIEAELGIERPVNTFSIGFEDIGEEYGSEFEYSDQVVARYATAHHKYFIPNDQVLARLPEAVDNMAEPMFGQDAVAFYLLSEQVAQDVKVVMSGQGADEVFGGYFWYPQMAASAQAHPEKPLLEHFAPFYFDRAHEEWLEMIAPQFHPEGQANVSGEKIADLLGAPGADDYLDRVFRLDTTRLITDDPVKRVDNMTMAWGLEARVPFLDYQTVELAMQMPPELKMREGGKYPLKALARGRIPDSVIDRPKGYFPMPALKYVRGEFLDFMRDILTSEACRNRGLYQRAYVEKLLAEPEKHHTRLQGSKLWHMALFEYWLQRNT